MRKLFAYAKTKAQISCAVTEQLISALLYSPVCFWFGLMLNVPVNYFSVMLGRSHRFLGITSTIWGGGGVNLSCKRTKHGGPSGARNPDL